MSDEFDRTPPHDLLAEQVALGGMMLSKDAVADVFEVIKPDDYYRPAHQVIHRVIADLYEGGEPVDAVTVAAELVRRGDISRVGGHTYLHDLIAGVPTAANAGYYARIVKVHALSRRLIEVGTRITQTGYAADSDPEEAFDLARAWIDEASGSLSDKHLSGMDELTRLVVETIEAGGTHRGLSTGFNDLDALINGLGPEQLVIVAARPSMGKSVIGLNFAAAAAVHDRGPRKRVHFHSMEMSAPELTMRLLSAEARVPLNRLKTGDLEDRHWERLAKVYPRVTDAPLVIDDTAGQSVSTIRGGLRAAQRTDPAGLVVVDYLQLLAPAKRIENRQQEVSEQVRGLKNLAKEFKVPVVALAQLNRNPENRADKRPILSDLRESGEIEQAADIVILLHREDAYERESPRAGEMDLIVAKQRNGPTAIVTVAFQGHYARAVDMAPI